MSKFENQFFKFLDASTKEHEMKVAKYALHLYNKINGTSYKSKAPKIVILRININNKRKKRIA